MDIRHPRPFAGSADVQRRERSWVLSAGSRQFSFTRVDYSASFPATHWIVSRPVAPRWRPTAVIGTMLGLVGGATLLGLAISSTGATAGYRYVVSVPVPVAMPATRHATAGAGGHRAATIGHATIATPPIQPSKVMDVVDYTVGDLEPMTEGDGASTMTAAIGAALASGHLQQWTSPDGRERGFVVVGPAEAGAGRCRALSILTKRDGDDDVQTRRECPGGRAATADAAAANDEDQPVASTAAMMARP